MADLFLMKLRLLEGFGNFVSLCLSFFPLKMVTQRRQDPQQLSVLLTFLNVRRESRIGVLLLLRGSARDGTICEGKTRLAQFSLRRGLEIPLVSYLESRYMFTGMTRRRMGHERPQQKKRWAIPALFSPLWVSECGTIQERHSDQLG